MVCLAPVALGVAYYVAYLSGCTFDGKQGIGDIAAMQISARYGLWALAAVLSAFILLFAGIFLLCRRNANETFALFLLIAVVGLPFSFWLTFEGSVHGTQVCKPS